MKEIFFLKKEKHNFIKYRRWGLEDIQINPQTQELLIKLFAVLNPGSSKDIRPINDRNNFQKKKKEKNIILLNIEAEDQRIFKSTLKHGSFWWELLAVLKPGSSK